MGKVAKLHYGLEQITKNYREKNINFETAEQLHLGACIESIADSLAWYMDRTEKRDRYDDALPTDELSDELNKKLTSYAYSNYGGNQEAFNAVINLPISDWVEEIKEGTENGE